ncbi:hypothetical protein FRC20_003029 [Serendipita sp. 405]|nr:hypothetical protein FRC20_003029 [Serendipita sp. 405]
MSSRIYLNLVWAAYGVEAEEEEDGEDERRRVVSMTTGIYPESTSNRWTRPAVHTDALTFSIHPSDERRERQHAFPMAITDYAWKHEANSTSKV